MRFSRLCRRIYSDYTDRIENFGLDEAWLDVSGNELRKQVNALRREGVPIASSGEGYFYAENAAEIYATIRSLQKMRQGLDTAIAGLEQALEKFGESS